MATMRACPTITLRLGALLAGNTHVVRVWIDQDLSTGDGLCVDTRPDVFVLLEDGIAYVQDDPGVLNDPGGAACAAHAADHDERSVIGAAVDCPC